MLSLFSKKKQKNDLSAIADAVMIPLEDVKDEVFSKKIMGDGVAFTLKNNVICAPCSGVIEVLFPTGHAFGIKREDGVEVLVHIGLDTVNLNGKGFKALACQGDKVKCGSPIIQVDIDSIKAAGYDLTTMLIVTETKDKIFHFNHYGDIKIGDSILES